MAPFECVFIFLLFISEKMYEVFSAFKDLYYNV